MRKYSNRLIEEFEQATRLEAWAGAQPPEERHGIHAAFNLAKLKLENEMQRLKSKERENG
jgi:hypothetical protein